MSDDDTILERDYTGLACVTSDPSWQRREAEACRGVQRDPGEDLRAMPIREHPSVAAWRHSANMWRDRCHRHEAKAAFWRSAAVGMAIGMAVGLVAWGLWS